MHLMREDRNDSFIALKHAFSDTHDEFIKVFVVEIFPSDHLLRIRALVPKIASIRIVRQMLSFEFPYENIIWDFDAVSPRNLDRFICRSDSPIGVP
jgi:hypothetical protein